MDSDVLVHGLMLYSLSLTHNNAETWWKGMAQHRKKTNFMVARKHTG